MTAACNDRREGWSCLCDTAACADSMQCIHCIRAIDIARGRVHSISPERARAKEGCSIMASAVFELFGPWLVR